MPAVSPPPERIVFFDGVCGLCNRFVDRLLRWDKQRVLRFAPLQGSTAAARLATRAGADLTTVVLLDENGVHTRSEAALRIIAQLGGAWRLINVLRIFPRALRDAVYDWIARRRYGWFGKREACRVPTAEERGVFFD